MLDDGEADFVDLVSQDQSPGDKDESSAESEGGDSNFMELEPLAPFPRQHELAVLGIGVGVGVGVLGLLYFLAKAKHVPATP